jgi:hypothetical protein
LTERVRLVAGDRVRGEGVHVNNALDFARSGRKARVEPMEGVLARSVFVVLTRRRVQRSWRGMVLGRDVFI